MALVVALSAVICVIVAGTQWWMTDRTGDIDSKQSVAEPPE